MKKETSLEISLRRLTIVPLICLGTLILLITVTILYLSLTRETEEGLKNLCYSFAGICERSGSGEYKVENGHLYKGAELFDASIVDEIYGVSGVDATLFYGDVRMVTTIRNENHTRAVGTKAAEEVSEAVLVRGENYFSTKVSVRGVPYYGYYIPLKEDNGSIAGMLFVGKSRHQVMESLERNVSLTCLMTLAVISGTAFLTFSYSQKNIYAIKKIREFLGQVAHGDMMTKMDPYVLERTDELGEMGRFSVELQKSVVELIGTDPLTGLNNRRSCMIILDNLMQDYERNGIPFSVAIGDIDDFKVVNDTYGHLAGDCVLKALAGMFGEHMVHRGFVARWGGEEFLFIYENAKRDRACAGLEELKQQISRHVTVCDENEISVTMTFGITECGDHPSMECILKQADENLYHGKSQGKNCIV